MKYRFMEDLRVSQHKANQTAAISPINKEKCLSDRTIKFHWQQYHQVVKEDEGNKCLDRERDHSLKKPL